MRWSGRFVDRDIPSAEIGSLFDLVAEIADTELADAARFEATGEFPKDVYRTLGEAGLLALPYPAQFGGGDQPAEVSLQVLEELAYSWLAVGIGVSVHNLACFPMVTRGSDEQQATFLPRLLGGDVLGSYCLSESTSGSDAASLQTSAHRSNGHYVVTGSKAWITHSPVADFFTVMVRTGESGPHGISCLHIAADSPGITVDTPERKMGAQSSPTAAVHFDHVHVPADQLIGDLGAGFPIALVALDAGRLGIAACAVGLANAALDAASTYAKDRVQFGRPIIDFQGVSFMLADMAAQVFGARAAYLAAARLKDAGEPFTREAAMAKLLATDAAMRITTDAISVLGGAGYTADYPVERYFREAKVLQIVEGTNQIQRLVIGRSLA